MLNKQIESLRRKMGWSQAELARRLHITPSTVGMYEQGRRVPSVDILLAMSEEFGVTLDYLITGKMCPPGGSQAAQSGGPYSRCACPTQEPLPGRSDDHDHNHADKSITAGFAV